VQEKNLPYHIPALLNEAIDAINIKENGIYVDVTFGGGGHSKEILKRLGDKGKLIAFDRDEDALKNKINDKRFMLLHKSFKNITDELKTLGIEKIDGLLADIGVSSHQFDEAHRGFSFRFEAALDMRMDNREQLSAYHIINTYTEKELQNIFSMYGEVHNARTLSIAIVQARQKEKLSTINQFIEVLKKYADKKDEKGYYAKVFQALRIEVNQELTQLKSLLQQCNQIINERGRLVVIAYHSLEDKIVKNFIASGTFDNNPEKDIYGNITSKKFSALNKKPIEPSAEEIKNNPRARSAKMRVAERVQSTKY
jgi:16S rRNA (cytosine1402-N4)-methyltransferase